MCFYLDGGGGCAGFTSIGTLSEPVTFDFTDEKMLMSSPGCFRLIGLPLSTFLSRSGLL